MNKIKKIKNIRVIDDEYVEKEEKDLIELYNYLKSRDFNYFPNIVERNDKITRYEFIEDYSISDDQKALDLIDTLALLHNKTSFNKEVSIDKNKEIYEQLKGYRKYLNQKYETTLEEIEYIEYPSPSNQLFLQNYSKLYACLEFIDKEIDEWYRLIENDNKERVSMTHGNPGLDHIIKNDRTYLISWNNAKIESPIIDLVTLYHNVWNRVEFSSLLNRYLERCELSNNELKLLLINLSFPINIDDKDTELENTIEMDKFINYLYKTEKLIRPYYSK